MVPVHCISRSNRLKIDFQIENLKKTSEITKPRALIFGMKHHLVNLEQVCSNYTPGAKHGPAPGVTCFTKTYTGKNMEIFLSETIRLRALIFGM